MFVVAFIASRPHTAMLVRAVILAAASYMIANIAAWTIRFRVESTSPARARHREERRDVVGDSSITGSYAKTRSVVPTNSRPYSWRIRPFSICRRTSSENVGAVRRPTVPVAVEQSVLRATVRPCRNSSRAGGQCTCPAPRDGSPPCRPAGSPRRPGRTRHTVLRATFLMGM